MLCQACLSQAPRSTFWMSQVCAKYGRWSAAVLCVRAHLWRRCAVGCEITPGQDRTGDLQRVRLTSQALDHSCAPTARTLHTRAAVGVASSFCGACVLRASVCSVSGGGCASAAVAASHVAAGARLSRARAPYFARSSASQIHLARIELATFSVWGWRHSH